MHQIYSCLETKYEGVSPSDIIFMLTTKPIGCDCLNINISACIFVYFQSSHLTSLVALKKKNVCCTCVTIEPVLTILIVVLLMN